MDPHPTPKPLKEYRKRRWERILLALTLLLVVAITSLEVQTSIVDYYLHLLPGVIYSNARQRLHSRREGRIRPDAWCSDVGRSRRRPRGRHGVRGTGRAHGSVHA